MTKLPLYEEIERLLEQANAYLGAAETQGLLCGYCNWQTTAPDAWLSTVLKEATGKSATKAKEVIQLMLAHSQNQLNDFNFELDMLLPSDEQNLLTRTEALASWCQGYLVGLEMGRGKKALTLSPDTKEALDDLKQIAKLELEDTVDEDSEAAYTDLVEFVKLTAIMIFTELNAQSKPTYH